MQYLAQQIEEKQKEVEEKRREKMLAKKYRDDEKRREKEQQRQADELLQYQQAKTQAMNNAVLSQLAANKKFREWQRS